MKISDELVLKYFNVKPEQIEYLVNSQTLAIYIQPIRFTGYTTPGYIKVEISVGSLATYLVLPEYTGSSSVYDKPHKVLISNLYIRDAWTAEQILEKAREEMIKLRDIFGSNVVTEPIPTNRELLTLD